MENKSWKETLDLLELGEIRVASQRDDGTWIVHQEVKSKILEAFKEGKITTTEDFYLDKDNLLPQTFSPQRKVRIVPRGTAIRRGSYLGEGVIVMPPSYINVGAYIDQNTMVDSHVLVGSCAQIGKNVHLSAGVQIGGVLEPIGEKPVIIEDDVFIGAGCMIVEGRIIKKRAILAPGVILSSGVPIYDTVREKILSKADPIPEGAVVVPGSRPFTKDSWAASHGLQKYCPMIIKYRDEKSSSSVTLEQILR